MLELLAYFGKLTPGSWTNFAQLVLLLVICFWIYWKGLPVFITAIGVRDAKLRDHYDRELKRVNERLLECEEAHDECRQKLAALNNQFSQFQRSIARALPHSAEIEKMIDALDRLDEGMKDDL